MRKFFEDPNGGRDYTGTHGYLQSLRAGDTFGFGYEFATGNIFFTRNGGRLPNAFIGKYLPTRHGETGYDVHAAIGVSGRTEVRVNFGVEPFVWKEANMPQWRVECHVGRLGGTSDVEDELPAYGAPPPA
jgi:Ran-binding protein 9/10